MKALAVELPLMGVVLNSILPPLAVIQPRGFESIPWVPLKWKRYIQEVKAEMARRFSSEKLFLEELAQAAGKASWAAKGLPIGVLIIPLVTQNLATGRVQSAQNRRS